LTSSAERKQDVLCGKRHAKKPEGKSEAWEKKARVKKDLKKLRGEEKIPAARKNPKALKPANVEIRETK